MKNIGNTFSVIGLVLIIVGLITGSISRTIINNNPGLFIIGLGVVFILISFFNILSSSKAKTMRPAFAIDITIIAIAFITCILGYVCFTQKDSPNAPKGKHSAHNQPAVRMKSIKRENQDSQSGSAQLKIKANNKYPTPSKTKN